MTEKLRIIEALGEGRLMLPGLVNLALAANDRAKYRFTLLQTAQARADDPDGRFPDLRSEREACGISDADLDTVVAESRRSGSSRYAIPQSGRIASEIAVDLETMLAPVKEADPEAAAGFTTRLEALRPSLAPPAEDRPTRSWIGRITAADRDGNDTPHLLVMDLHKELNRLQAAIATETLDGAQAYGLSDGDRPLVRAFMRGVNRTAPLKFDHPGLSTTATRAGERLVIQNDIGTTDAHVIVVHVEGNAATVTYTDVHLQRLLFLQQLLERYPVKWDDTVSRTDRSMDEGIYHLAVGRFEARDPAQMEDYLAFLGSRLVFLIDWNRARKRLQAFARRSLALRLLRRAADADQGHMAFLRAGGEYLIYDALTIAAEGQLRPGERLDAALGQAATEAFLSYVLRVCSEGLLAGRSEALVRDEVRAELARHFRSREERLLDVASEHAAIIFELAAAVRDALNAARLEERPRLDAIVARAKSWESQADEFLNQARAQAMRSPGAAFFLELLVDADDVADDLEEAVFHLSLTGASARQLPEPVLDAMGQLGGLALAGAQEMVKVLEAVRYIGRGAPREHTVDFLEAVHRVMGVERSTDDAQRAVERALMAYEVDSRVLYAVAEAARNIENATDGMMHACLRLRDRYLTRANA